jgi:uroporphyrinogen-III decarboxylase
MIAGGNKMARTWEQLSADEKQEEMFNKWLSPQGIEFASPQAEKAYKERVMRIKDAIQLKKKPDRVPVLPLPSFFPAFYAGYTPEEVMYDYDKCADAWRKFVFDFEPDAHMGCAGPGPGKFYEILDYKLYAWPGHGVPAEHSYQACEGEYMTAEEYDDLIDDPSHFFTHNYLPRVFGKLDGFKMLPALTGILEIYGVAFNFIPFGLPPVQETYKALFEAGAEALKWAGAVGGFDVEMAANGFPALLAGFTKAPFDVIGDTLRGTRGIMLDMYRRPDKLIEAMEAITPIMIKMGVGAAQMNARPMIFIPLHKGADGFLSDEQFKKFYWPTFKKVLLGLIDEGCVPFPVAEGGYNTRLDVIKDLPRGKVLWMFDVTDMAKAKEVLGDTASIAGNMRTDLLTIGTPQQVKEYAKNLIDVAGKGGGYILSNGAFFDDVKPENIKTMVDVAKGYGVYK